MKRVVRAAGALLRRLRIFVRSDPRAFVRWRHPVRGSLLLLNGFRRLRGEGLQQRRERILCEIESVILVLDLGIVFTAHESFSGDIVR